MSEESNRRSGLVGAPAVQELVSDAQAEQDRQAHPRDRSWDAQRTKVTYDLPPELIQRVKEIAAEIGAEYSGAKIRHGDVARLLMEAGLRRYEAGELKITLVTRQYGIFFD